MHQTIWTPLRPILVAIALLGVFGALTASAQAKNKRPIAVYPAVGTQFASDTTTFSFRGVKPKHLGKVKVFGSKTGQVGHTRLKHSDGRGVSIVPKEAFVPGEGVRVITRRNLVGAKSGTFSVRIGRHYGPDDEPGGPNEVPVVGGLKSRPDLKPPKIDLQVPGVDAAPGKVFIAPREDGYVIADNYGRISWFRPVNFAGANETINGFRTQTYQGRPVLTTWLGRRTQAHFAQIGYFEIRNRKYNRIRVFKPGNGYGADTHEFRITPWNTALVISYRGVIIKDPLIPGGEGRVIDGVVQEVDIKTGAVLFEWHSLDDVPLDQDNPQTHSGEGTWDYFHLNSVAPDGKKGFIISARRNSGVYRINRKNAKVSWYLNGINGGDFDLAEDAGFIGQHDAQRLPNGEISIFDNGRQGGRPGTAPPGAVASGLVLRLSRENGARKATLVKRYVHPGMEPAGARGNFEILPNGNPFIGWGSIPQVTEHSPEGEVLFDLTFEDLEADTYRAYKAPWHGIPKGRPAIASESDGSGGATVWVSWNGSQSTARWRVLTGSDRTNLEPVKTSNWKNLETEIDVPVVGEKIQVEAISHRGKTIGRSAIAAVGVQKR